MSLLTYTETSSSLYTGYYGTNEWRDGNVAYQGRWTGSGTKAQRIGLIFFEDLVTNMTNKVINSISITCTIGGAGTSGSKKMRCWISNFDSYNSAETPQSYLKEAIQDFTVPSRNQTYTFEFDENAVTKFANSIKDGIGTLAIYLPESEDGASSQGSYSINYMQIDSVQITIQYYNGTVKIYTTSGWKNAIPYIYDGGWKQAIPYIYDQGWKIGGG